MQTLEPQPVKSTWPVGTPSRYGPLASMIYEQTRLEFRAHDGQRDAVHLLLSLDNRAERLRLARAIGHAAHTLRASEGLANDVVNLVHEANRLIARRPVPPRRRKMDLMRVEHFLTEAGIGGDLPLSAFPADELPDPDLRLRLDFIGHNNDQAYPNVLCFRYDLFQNRDNLEPATEEESTTPPKTETNATATPGSADRQVRNSAASSKGPGSAGIGLPALRVNGPAHLATLVTVLLLFAFLPSPPLGAGLQATRATKSVAPKEGARNLRLDEGDRGSAPNVLSRLDVYGSVCLHRDLCPQLGPQDEIVEVGLKSRGDCRTAGRNRRQPIHPEPDNIRANPHHRASTHKKPCPRRILCRSYVKTEFFNRLLQRTGAAAATMAVGVDRAGRRGRGKHSMTDPRRTSSTSMTALSGDSIPALSGKGVRTRRLMMLIPDLTPSEEAAYAIDMALTLESHGHAVRLLTGEGVWQNLLDAHRLDYQILPGAMLGLRSPLNVRRALKSLDTCGAELIFGFETGSLRLLNLFSRLRKLPQILAITRAYDPALHHGAAKIRINRSIGCVMAPIQSMRECLVNDHGIPAGLCEVVPPCADSRMALSGPSEIESLWTERMPSHIFERPAPNPYAESDGAVEKPYSPESRDDETRRLTVATAGRLVADRGVETFIGLVAELALKRPGIDFVIFGGGPDEAKLRKRIETLGLTPRILIVASSASWPALFPSIDVYVWSTDESGGEIPAIYAMGAGKPIIAVRGSGALELFGEEEVALLTETNDEMLRLQKTESVRSVRQGLELRRRMGSLHVEGLKKLLAQVLANRGVAEKMGQQAKRHALKLYSRNRQSEELAAVLAKFDKKVEVSA